MQRIFLLAERVGDLLNMRHGNVPNILATLIINSMRPELLIRDGSSPPTFKRP